MAICARSCAAGLAFGAVAGPVVTGARCRSARTSTFAIAGQSIRRRSIGRKGRRRFEQGLLDVEAWDAWDGHREQPQAGRRALGGWLGATSPKRTATATAASATTTRPAGRSAAGALAQALARLGGAQARAGRRRAHGRAPTPGRPSPGPPASARRPAGRAEGRAALHQPREAAASAGVRWTSGSRPTWRKNARKAAGSARGASSARGRRGSGRPASAGARAARAGCAPARGADRHPGHAQRRELERQVAATHPSWTSGSALTAAPAAGARGALERRQAAVEGTGPELPHRGATARSRRAARRSAAGRPRRRRGWRARRRGPRRPAGASRGCGSALRSSSRPPRMAIAASWRSGWLRARRAAARSSSRVQRAPRVARKARTNGPRAASWQLLNPGAADRARGRSPAAPWSGRVATLTSPSRRPTRERGGERRRLATRRAGRASRRRCCAAC